MQSETQLNPEELNQKILSKLKALDKLSFLEQYAMFMGKAQIVEFGLKRLLIDEQKYEYEDVESKTLGWIIKELKNNGIREDFLSLLNGLLDYRNYFAHDFLADKVLMDALLEGKNGFTKPIRELSKASYIVEHVLIVHDFLKGGTFWVTQEKS